MTNNQGYDPVDNVMRGKLQGGGLDTALSGGLICPNGGDCVHNDQ